METAAENLPELNSIQQPSSENELMELIHRLPTGYKTVFNLYAIEGYSHEEIGTMLGIKASTSRSQYTRAREMLKSALQEISYKNTTDEQ
jgi:RNA polymerase sigma-70 factor (ECF subfamily)